MASLFWASGAALMLSAAGVAQLPLSFRPAKTAAVHHRSGIHRMTARGFKIINQEGGVTTFLLLTDPTVGGRGVPRTTLSAGGSATYPCGAMGSSCYVRFAANGGVQNVAVLWHHVYEFAGQGKTFDLYDLTPDE